MIVFVQDEAERRQLRLPAAQLPHEGPYNFARWLALFKHIAEHNSTMAIIAQDLWLPILIPQRRMIERLALRYALRTEGASGALTAGLAAYRPDRPRGPADSQGVGLGRRDAPIILVGDAPQLGAPRWAVTLGWPFISGLPTGCSGWLAEQLEEYDVPESDLFWLNARLQTGEPDQRARERLALYYCFPVRSHAVIALGRHAATTLEEWGMPPDEEVHHPQHWKRFHHRQEYILARLINKHRRRLAKEHQAS